jgi:hypothetical protein
MRLMRILPLLALAAAFWPARDVPAAQPAAVVWTLDNLNAVGGHRLAVEGSPRLAETSAGRAVEFDGVDDGLFVDVNPLEGLGRFTVEVVFEPAPDGSEEQRFLHFQETGSEDRALVELRLLAGGSWCLDTFLRDGSSQLTLIDRLAAHPAARWHVAALIYDGQTMSHYVNGTREATGMVRIAPLGAGRTSIGVRQNRVSWFKGRIRLIRVTPEALAQDRLLAVPAR